MPFNRGWSSKAVNTCVSNSKHEQIRTLTQMWAEVTACSNFTPCFQVYIAEQMADMSRKKQACHEKSRNQKNLLPSLKSVKQHPNKSDLSFIEVRRRLWSVFSEGKWSGGGEKQARLSSLSLSLQHSTPILLHVPWHDCRAGAIFSCAAFYF